MRAGRLDFRVTFMQREQLGEYEYGDYQVLLADYPAEYRRLSGAEQLDGGGLVDVEQGTLYVRDSAETRRITASDRVVIGGRDFAIKTVSVPVRRLRRIEMTVASGLGS